MKRIYWKEIVESGKEDDFLKNCIEEMRIPKELIEDIKELTFIVNKISTMEKIKVYIPQKDLLKYFKRIENEN